MEVQLAILAKDIMENRYSSCRECPITRALARAGFPGLHEGGGDIFAEEDGICGKYIMSTYSNPAYYLMDKKVLGMYRTKEYPHHADDDNWWNNAPAIPIEDFTITLKLPDKYYKPQN